MKCRWICEFWILIKSLRLMLQLVAGSAIQAFEEVCPERIDLIHKNYRKLCNLLVDVEEWGQVVIINMLTRYIRTQFINPNSGVCTRHLTDEISRLDCRESLRKARYMCHIVVKCEIASVDNLTCTNICIVACHDHKLHKHAWKRPDFIMVNYVWCLINAICSNIWAHYTCWYIFVSSQLLS